MGDYSNLKPCFRPDGTIIINDDGPINRFDDILALLAVAGLEIFNADGTFFLMKNKHGNIVSPPLLKSDISMFLSGFMVGVAQPSKYQESIRAFLVEPD